VQSIWKLDNPDVLRMERAQKLAAKAEKEKQKLEAAKKAQEREEKAKIPPSEMFLAQTDLYSAFDSNGMPTTDAKTGEPLSASMLKKLTKEYSKQKETYEKYLAKAAAATA